MTTFGMYRMDGQWFCWVGNTYQGWWGNEYQWRGMQTRKNQKLLCRKTSGIYIWVDEIDEKPADWRYYWWRREWKAVIECVWLHVTERKVCPLFFRLNLSIMSVATLPVWQYTKHRHLLFPSNMLILWHNPHHDRPWPFLSQSPRRFLLHIFVVPVKSQCDGNMSRQERS